MAESSRPVPPPKRGPLGKLVAAILAFSFWLLPGMPGNILFEWCVDVVVWPEDGPAHGDGRGRTARHGGDSAKGYSSDGLRCLRVK
ncbi:MAG: hypothetical protein NTX45_00590 [Proteobacteria bacterium]|nr:hypothetical protein [Pseudomonadota bacterium]